jgi:3-phosphoshikimate 1-carboxyvinyltransferase
MSFNFKGNLDISKSWMNRALILKSYQPRLEIIGESQADDVKLLQQCLNDLKNGKKEFYVGFGGTTFRFFALRVSREIGNFVIRAEKKLFDRPQQELIHILEQVGVKAYFNSEKTEFHIESRGWLSAEIVKELKVDAKDSSQFLTAVLLNSIDLPFDLQIETSKIASESYFNYTQKMMNDLGFAVDDLFVSNLQRIVPQTLQGEVDVSSFASLAAAAVLDGKVHLTNWNKSSHQPDMEFLTFFKRMGIAFITEDSNFFISKQSQWFALKADFSKCPDLFPVMAILCAFAEGESDLYGAHQLIHKESDRLEKTYELLTRCGFSVSKKQDGLIIRGNPVAKYVKKDLIQFNPEHDHRMAFAARLLQLKGFPVIITDPDVINKSYPQFYQHTGVQP